MQSTKLAVMPMLPLKIAVWLFVVVWASLYAWYYPLENFLWTCNVAVFLVAAALALDNHRLLLSVCLVLVLVPDIGWTIDVAGAALTGRHIVGGTEYIFNSEIPLVVRLMSFEHVLMAPLLVYLVSKCRYDRRALPIASALVFALYYLSYFVATPENPVNWVWGLFGRTQTLIAPALYPMVAACLAVLVLLLPAHYLARRFLGAG